MAQPEVDVLAIGNALVDVIAAASDGRVAELGCEKGAMTLIDAQRAQALYADMGPGREISGGAAANSCVGLAALGRRARFIGRVARDQLGEVFAHDIRAAGVLYDTAPGGPQPPTGRCLILVTPDGQRTMNTFLGASHDLEGDDIAREHVVAAGILYLEGYQWDPPTPRAAMRRAMGWAREAGRRIAFALSDVWCVEGHRAEFRQMLADGWIDILFANEREAMALFQTGDIHSTLSAAEGAAPVVVITRSEKGAVVMAGPTRHAIPPAPAERVIDTTGAGDLFAAGFLAGVAEGRPWDDCARLGAVCAAEIISHWGARPEADLKVLAKAAGL